MKRLYWRPRQVSQTVIWLMAAFSLLGLASVERFRTRARSRTSTSRWKHRPARWK